MLWLTVIGMFVTLVLIGVVPYVIVMIITDAFNKQKSDRKIRIWQNEFDKHRNIISLEMKTKQEAIDQEELRLSKLTDREIEYENDVLLEKMLGLEKAIEESEIERRIRDEIEEEFQLKQQKKLEDKIRARIESEYSYSN